MVAGTFLAVAVAFFAQGGNANTAMNGASVIVWIIATASMWGTGGTYTKGGVNQTGGSAIVTGTGTRINTNDTLIASPTAPTP